MSNNTNLFAGIDRCRDREILNLALSNLADLLASQSSADREHLGSTKADAWIARCEQLQSELFLLAGRETYVIHSASESAASDGAGFWSNADGWTTIEGATRFAFHEKRDFENLPISSGSDADWMLLSEAAADQSTSSSIIQEEAETIRTTLFSAINSSNVTILCGAYEIDTAGIIAPGYVRLDCGDDVIAVLKDQEIEIDRFGSCTVTIPEDEVTEDYAHQIEVGAEVSLTFKVTIPVRSEDLAKA